MLIKSCFIIIIFIFFTSCANKDEIVEEVVTRHIILINIEDLSSGDILGKGLFNIELLMRNGVYSNNIYDDDSLGLAKYTNKIMSDSISTIYSVIKNQTLESRTAFLTNCNFAETSTQREIDVMEIADSDSNFFKKAREILKNNKPTFFHLQLCASDSIEIKKRNNSLKIADSLVGAVLDEVGYSSMYGKTVVIITAVSSTNSNENLQKPFIINGFGIKVGRVIEESIYIEDVMATILHILNLNQPKGWKGKPLLNVFSAKNNLY